jgi:hypothetical protein
VTRRERVHRAVTRRARAEVPFRSRRLAIIAWLAIVVVVFGGSALHALLHHGRGI